MTTEKKCPKCGNYMAKEDTGEWHCIYCGKYEYENVHTRSKCKTPGCIKVVNGGFDYCTDCDCRRSFQRGQGGKRGIAA